MSSTVLVGVVGQGQAGCVDGDGGEHHGLRLGHGEVLHSHLLGEDGQGEQGRPRHVTNDHRSQDGQHTEARRRLGDENRAEE